VILVRIPDARLDQPALAGVEQGGEQQDVRIGRVDAIGLDLARPTRHGFIGVDADQATGVLTVAFEAADQDDDEYAHAGSVGP